MMKQLLLCIQRIIKRLPLPPMQTWGKQQEFNTCNYNRYKNMTYLQNSKLTIKDSKDVAKVFLDLLALEDKIDQEKEHFYVMHLDVKSRVNLVELVSLGTLNASLVHPRGNIQTRSYARFCKYHCSAQSPIRRGRAV